MSETMRIYLAWAVIALVLIIGIVFVLGHKPSEEQMRTAEVDLNAIPPLTPEIQKQLAESKGFSVLISYTERGFEPSEATIKKGEAVRFTNNSQQDLWVAASTGGGKIYPGVANGCGSSELDTCKALKPLEFWEFTFVEAGVWTFQNNVDTSQSGVVTVIVK